LSTQTLSMFPLSLVESTFLISHYTSDYVGSYRLSQAHITSLSYQALLDTTQILHAVPISVLLL